MDQQLLDKLDRIRSLARAQEIRLEVNDPAGALEALEQLTQYAAELVEDDLVDREVRIKAAGGGHFTGICRGAARLASDLRPRGIALQQLRKGKARVVVVPFESIREIGLPRIGDREERSEVDDRPS